MEKGIHAYFHGYSLQLTNDVEVHLVELRVTDANPESLSEVTATKLTALPVPVAIIGPELISTL